MVITAASVAYLNPALEPTPTAAARASLWLLARLTASVRLPWKEAHWHTADVRRRSCGTAPSGVSSCSC
jgi:hypothetical protein